MRPVIGISGNQSVDASGRSGLFLGVDYYEAIHAVGGIPLVLTFGGEPDALADLAGRIDGLLLSGGDDVNPQVFGEEPRLGLGSVTPARDALEVELFHRMRELGKPIFGICRGLQLMNAAMGGTLYQDLGREWPGNMQHAQKGPRQHTGHGVQVRPDTRLRAILETDRVLVNTFHHQAVHSLAPGLIATAHSQDGLVEALELPGDEFVLGVQWHPENLWRTMPEHRSLFAAFVRAAARAQGAQQGDVVGAEEKEGA